MQLCCRWAVNVKCATCTTTQRRILCRVSSATVRRTKKLTRPRKLPGPWTTTRNKQYLSAVHPVTCSLLWVRRLFDLISILGQMTPRVKTFEFVFRIHRRNTELRFVTKFGENRRLRSCRKVEWFTKQKTRAPRHSSQPPFWPKWADHAQNYLNVVTPWHVHVYRICSGSAAFCRTYSGKIDFSAQNVNTIGFQPTINKHNRKSQSTSGNVCDVSHDIIRYPTRRIYYGTCPDVYTNKLVQYSFFFSRSKVSVRSCHIKTKTKHLMANGTRGEGLLRSLKPYLLHGSDLTQIILIKKHSRANYSGCIVRTKYNTVTSEDREVYGICQ